MEEKPNFYAILPAKIRYAKNISSTAKIIYAEITALTKLNGYCYATNKYLAKLYGLELRHVQRIINQLKENNYIFIKYLNNNRRQIRVSDIINQTPIQDLFDYDWLNED